MDNPELELATRFIEDTRCHVFLTGRAGTGKTTFLHQLKRDSAKRMVVTAPTGVAAINAAGVTLHSFFQLPHGPLVPGNEHLAQQGRRRFSKEKIRIIKSMDLLAIDEVSMVRADLLDGVDAVLRRYRRSDLPFGGVQLLMIGDLYQLPPVVRDQEWTMLRSYYDSAYFFSSRALARSELITIELRRIYRQSDNRFIEILNRVRDNDLDQKTLELLNNRYLPGFQTAAQEGYITLCTHNRGADLINRKRLSELKTPCYRFKAEIEGDFPEHSYPTASVLELKKGAQVMFVRNDSPERNRYFNGKIGRVTRIRDQSIWVRCPGDEHEIEVEPVSWDNIRYRLDENRSEIREERLGSFSQVPLRLAWAITIHKSQGLTFDRAVIDVSRAFACGQVYVALSRCRSLEGLVLSAPVSRQAVQTDPLVARFMEEATATPPDRRQLQAAAIRYQQELILECFSFRRYRFLLGRLVSLLQQNARLIHVAGDQDPATARQELDETVCSVGERFQRQLQGLFRQDREPGTDPVILERLAKAAEYFQERLTGKAATMLTELEVETDNRELGQRIRRYLLEFTEEAAVKLAAVRCCRQGFSPADYLRAISAAQVTARQRKSRKKHQREYSESDVGHSALHARLKEWRAAQAVREGGKPHYQILHQRILVQIAVTLPDTLKELLKIKGIGKRTAEKYGADLIALVTAYRQEHGITEVVLPEPRSPEPAPTPKKGKKKNTRLISLEMFNAGKTIEEIARERNLVVSTIEGHLATFVEQGELPLDRVLAPERQQAIEEQLDSMETDSLADIRRALDNAYSYGEIKLVLAHRKYLDSATNRSSAT